MSDESDENDWRVQKDEWKEVLRRYTSRRGPQRPCLLGYIRDAQLRSSTQLSVRRVGLVRWVTVRKYIHWGSKKTGPFFIWAQLSQKLSDFNNSFTVADRHYVHKRIIEFITLPIVCCCTTLKNATAYTSSQKNCWINLQCMRWFHCCYKAQNSGVISGKTVMTVLLMLASVMFWLTESPRELLLHPLSKWIYVTVTW